MIIRINSSTLPKVLYNPSIHSRFLASKTKVPYNSRDTRDLKNDRIQLLSDTNNNDHFIVHTFLYKNNKPRVPHINDKNNVYLYHHHSTNSNAHKLPFQV